ncbi:hypothetical protein KGN64_003344 [Salmonella enterica]|nr:hypothetical protein [Salmonella enterica]EHM5264157.1 hypothetical protein [Salmonella enterica]
MTTITKEQLIEKAKENVVFFRERLDLLPQSQPMALSLRLAEVALAVLTAEIEAWTDEDELDEMHQCGVAKIFRSHQLMGRPDPNRVVKLVRLPEI